MAGSPEVEQGRWSAGTDRNYWLAGECAGWEVSLGGTPGFGAHQLSPRGAILRGREPRWREKFRCGAAECEELMRWDVQVRVSGRQLGIAAWMSEGVQWEPCRVAWEGARERPHFGDRQSQRGPQWRLGSNSHSCWRRIRTRGHEGHGRVSRRSG